VSGSPFHEEWISAETLAQALDVLMQRVPKVDEYAPLLLVISCDKKFRAQSADPIFKSRQ
jgi:hypothetical protein